MADLKANRDDFTATVDAAAAFEWHRSEPDYDDLPTLAECESDEAYLNAGRGRPTQARR